MTKKDPPSPAGQYRGASRMTWKTPQLSGREAFAVAIVFIVSLLIVGGVICHRCAVPLALEWLP